MTIKDLLGRTFSFSTPPKRVVSLVPSLTETLFTLGAGESVVGITDFCIFPTGLEQPRVGGTKNPRVDEIRALSPDVVYMNLEENLEKHAKAIEEFAPVFVTEPRTVDDVADLIQTLGSIHACEGRACELVAAMGRARVVIGSFTFAVPIWKEPWMWCGGDTYVSNLVEVTGGRNILRERTRYPTIPVDEVMSLRPDIVFLPDEPFLFTSADAASIKGPRIIGPFPGHLFTWHGARTIDGLRFLRDVLLDPASLLK